MRWSTLAANVCICAKICYPIAPIIFSFPSVSALAKKIATSSQVAQIQTLRQRQIIQWTNDGQQVLVGGVEVAQCRFKVVMPQQFLAHRHAGSTIPLSETVRVKKRKCQRKVFAAMPVPKRAFRWRHRGSIPSWSGLPQ